ncbi:HU family DNA-binding protein [Ornithinimicrobium cerasi]|uniref:DNA-binding protein HU-beta n=1 Tax=Ornithinimicrobium cerasi TaxID=2248773 RepID=A0A285VRF2_9MICO|nr:HU family DNA-binding protein [Ornithinimicrobium cerasi]SOC55191.1 DNA-binding protein HU-beta [Ornithinimicrobium cerasi]
MNKADLIEALAPKVGGRAVATQAVESLVDLVLREVASGGSVVVTGFGTFEKTDRAPRTGRNPRTGEAVPIGATSLPRFRPAAYFKDVVGDPARLPKDGLAGVRVGSDGTAPPREGVPPTVRRGSQPSAGTSGRARSAGSGDAPARRRKAATTGTPSTVRATAPVEPAPEAPEDETSPRSSGLVAGGEEITRGMINAKKAQLARVKSDEVARSAAKKDRKKSKDGQKDKAKEAEKGKEKSKEKGKGKGRSKGRKA